jgi:hypothetical protein
MDSTVDYETIRQIVFTWPAQQRFALVQDLLDTLAPGEEGQAPPKRNTLQRALGLLDMGQPTPSDAQIAEWLQARRREKYG